MTPISGNIPAISGKARINMTMPERSGLAAIYSLLSSLQQQKSKWATPMSEVTLRAATDADLPMLLSFEQGVVEAERPFNDTLREGPVSYYDIGALICSEDSIVLLAERQGQIIGSGYATLKRSLEYLKHERHAYLGFMYVVPEFRGEGVIQQVLDGLILWARQQSVNNFYLEVYADNEPAIRAYEKFGFQRNLVEMKLCERSD